MISLKLLRRRSGLPTQQSALTALWGLVCRTLGIAFTSRSMFSAWYDLVVMETQELEDSSLLNEREREAMFAWKESERKRKEHRLHACTLTDGLTQEHGNSVCACERARGCVFTLMDVLELILLNLLSCLVLWLHRGVWHGVSALMSFALVAYYAPPPTPPAFVLYTLFLSVSSFFQCLLLTCRAALWKHQLLLFTSITSNRKDTGTTVA